MDMSYGSALAPAVIYLYPELRAGSTADEVLV
jgi:hypothetical protein